VAPRAPKKSSKDGYDRLPPQDIDAERSVLGAMLLNPDAVGTGIEILHDNAGDVFYVEAHQHIYQAIVSLFQATTPVDEVTLVNQLMRAGALEAAGGVTYVSELVGAVPTSANIEHYARIVQEAAVLRRLISACTNLAGEAYGSPESVGKLLDRAEMEIFALAQTRQLHPVYRVSDLLEDGINRIEAVMKNKSGLTGLATGFIQLDALLSGLQPSDMLVLAARPSVGKTAFALNIASHAAIHEDKSVLLFSLEMSKEQLVQRLLCMEGQINSQKLRDGFLAKSEFPKLQRAADRLSRAKIFIDDSPGITVLDLKSKSRRHASQHGIDLLIVDYLQLMSSPGRSENRQTEIAEISRSIKAIARELRVPVLALSQLSREAERDDTGMPKLSHLRESGAIEQDADVVIMLSRPPVREGEEQDNMIFVNIAKQRNGPTGKVELLFDRSIQRFKNLAAPTPPGRAPEAASFTPKDSEVEYIEEEEGPPEPYDDEDETPF
jgi:replicative DNA helicase